MTSSLFSYKKKANKKTKTNSKALLIWAVIWRNKKLLHLGIYIQKIRVIQVFGLNYQSSPKPTITHHKSLHSLMSQIILPWVLLFACSWNTKYPEWTSASNTPFPAMITRLVNVLWVYLEDLPFCIKHTDKRWNGKLAWMSVLLIILLLEVMGSGILFELVFLIYLNLLIKILYKRSKLHFQKYNM